jgi:hypothetical protein
MSESGSLEIDASLSETADTCCSISEALPDAASSTTITTDSAGVSGWALARHNGQVECD